MKSSYRLLVFAILLIAISVVGYSTPTITEKTEVKFDVRQTDVSLENVVVNDLFVLNDEFEKASQLNFCTTAKQKEKLVKIDNLIITQRELSIFYTKKSVRINRFTDEYAETYLGIAKVYIKELSNLYPRNILNNSSGGISYI